MKFPARTPLVVPNVCISGPEGSIHVDLVLDTGAVYTVLLPHVLSSIGYETNRAGTEKRIVTAGGIVEARATRVNSISAGECEVHDTEVVCLSIPGLAQVGGLLGLSFLEHFRTVVDYRSGYCEIS